MSHAKTPDTAAVLAGDVWPFLDEHAEHLVRCYFHTFTGRAFDTLDGGGTAEHVANRFTPADIVAVSMLSVDIPAQASLKLLDEERWSDLLAEVGPDRPMWEADAEVFDNDAPAARLWSALKKVDGIGWVTAHKLCARKRPQLLPVYDRVLKAALQPTSKAFWVPLRSEMQSTDLRTALEEIAAKAGVPGLSLLRVLDVCVWMRNQGLAALRASKAVLPEGLAELPFTPRRAALHSSPSCPSLLAASR